MVKSDSDEPADLLNRIRDKCLLELRRRTGPEFRLWRSREHGISVFHRMNADETFGLGEPLCTLWFTAERIELRSPYGTCQLSVEYYDPKFLEQLVSGLYDRLEHTQLNI